MNALIIVDLQVDFCPGGALAVPAGDRIVPIVNRLASQFELVVATQDWHPPDHISFAVNHPGHQPGDEIALPGFTQALWPIHCVQFHDGADFHPDLDTSRIQQIIRKGTDPKIDSYSGFFDNARRRRTGLESYLRLKDVGQVYVCGLATDYCVKFTALDAVSLGFAAYCIEDATRGMNLARGDVERALAEMRAAGVRIVRSDAILRP